jgi:hypothetical protein
VGDRAPTRREGIKHGPFELTLFFEWVQGRMECVGLDIRPFSKPGRSDPEPLTTSRLRAIRLGGLIEKYRPKVPDQTLSGVTFQKAPTFPKGALSRRRGRRPKYGPEHYVEVARVYREGYKRNKTPTRYVARHFRTTPSAAAKWVAKCRAYGFLPKTKQGSARSEPRKGRKR